MGPGSRRRGTGQNYHEEQQKNERAARATKEVEKTGYPSRAQARGVDVIPTRSHYRLSTGQGFESDKKESVERLRGQLSFASARVPSARPVPTVRLLQRSMPLVHEAVLRPDWRPGVGLANV